MLKSIPWDPWDERYIYLHIYHEFLAKFRYIKHYMDPMGIDIYINLNVWCYLKGGLPDINGIITPDKWALQMGNWDYFTPK